MLSNSRMIKAMIYLMQDAQQSGELNTCNGGPTPVEPKKLTDDEIYTLVESWATSTRLRVYKFLNASGCNITGINYEISKALKEEKAG